MNQILRYLWEMLPARRRARMRAWWNPPTYPRVLQVEQTFKCNLKCVMCIHGYGDPEDRPDFSYEQFTALIDQFHGPDAAPGFDRLEAVELQGIGEPLLHKDTVRMVKYARERGIFTFFISNMTALTEKKARELVEAGHGYIIASVDSIDPEIFQDIRRGVNFNVLERVLRNMEILQRVKQEMGSELPELHVNSILMKRTLTQAPELVETLRNLGVRKIMFCDLIATGISPDMRFSDGSLCRDQSLMTLPPEELKRIMEELRQLDTPECRVVVPEDWGGISNRRRGDAVPTCEDLWEKPFVTSEGIVTPCCFLPDKSQMPMGNLSEQTFEEIWFGERYEGLRRAHIEGRAPADCQQCPQFVNTIELRSWLRGGAGPPNPPRNAPFSGDRRFKTGMRTQLQGIPHPPGQNT